MYFSDKHPGVLYIIVFIKIHIGNDMDKVHYVCDVLEYNIRTWWNCYYYTKTQYPGYRMNLYDDSSIDKNKN